MYKSGVRNGHGTHGLSRTYVYTEKVYVRVPCRAVPFLCRVMQRRPHAVPWCTSGQLLAVSYVRTAHGNAEDLCPLWALAGDADGWVAAALHIGRASTQRMCVKQLVVWALCCNQSSESSALGRLPVVQRPGLHSLGHCLVAAFRALVACWFATGRPGVSICCCE